VELRIYVPLRYSPSWNPQMHTFSVVHGTFSRIDDNLGEKQVLINLRKLKTPVSYQIIME
jgi:hypothetical protein